MHFLSYGLGVAKYIPPTESPSSPGPTGCAGLRRRPRCQLWCHEVPEEDLLFLLMLVLSCVFYLYV